MTQLTAYGSLLTASVDNRVLTYRLLPFGEQGRTNVGKITASKGTLTLPDATTLVANMEHDATRPVARFVTLTEEDTGLTASVRVLETTAGNDLLVEASEGVRTGISVEIDSPVIRDGALLGGTLTGAGFVTSPAFPSAQLVAADAGDLPADAVTAVTEALTTALQTITDSVVPADPNVVDPNAATAETSNGMEPNITAAAPAGLQAQAVSTDLKIESANDLFAQLAGAHTTGNTRMLAALDNAIAADVSATQNPQWASEIWSSRTHRQKYVGLFNPAPLTALKITGWKFTTGKTPTVDTYAGFPAQPTSTEVKTEAVTITASRVAGANAIDRAFVDFSTPEFWSGFYRESANDMSRKLDAAALAHMVTAGNFTDVDSSAVPAGVAKAISYILDGVLAIGDIAVPDFAIVGTDLFRELALTKASDAIAYLTIALGLDPAEGRLDQFRIIQSSDAALTGGVLVGASEAHTFYGEKSVRIDTVNISTGGVETGVYGYHAENTGDARAFALVNPAV